MPVKHVNGTTPQIPPVQTARVIDDPPSLNCPECGERLRHVHSDGQTHYFLCTRHGAMLLMLGGDVQRAAPETLVTHSPTPAQHVVSAHPHAAGTEGPGS